VKKTGHIFILFLRNILHLKKKDFFFYLWNINTQSCVITSINILIEIMLITFGIHLYEICTKNVFLICLVYFQNCAAIKKKVTMVSKHTLVQISLYPWLNGQYMLPY
jgi:hypothetical protein